MDQKVGSDIVETFQAQNNTIGEKAGSDIVETLELRLEQWPERTCHLSSVYHS